MDENRKIEKKKKIIETAYQLFRSAGISGPAIDDVVRAAGIARGTFYLYFKDKSDLIDQLVMYKSTETLKEMLASAHTGMLGGSGGDFFDTVRRTLEMYLDFLEQHKDVLLVLHKNISVSMRSPAVLVDEEIGDLYKEVLRQFEAVGFSAVQTEQTIFLVINMIDAVYTDALLYARPFSVQEIRPALIDASMAIFASRAALVQGGALDADHV